jgi:VanZ family protein
VVSDPVSSPGEPLATQAALVRDSLPAVAWMALIFVGSTDSFSSGQTSRIIGPLLRWLFPGLTEPTVDLVVFLVRKTAHVSEYAVLAGLWWRALRRPVQRAAGSWSWRAAGLAVLISALWAATDEFHQSFTATRTASVWDVLLDTAGGRGRSSTLGLRDAAELVVSGCGRQRIERGESDRHA